jgi:hypothetical protein
MKHEMSYFRRVLAALCMLGLWSPNWQPRGTLARSVGSDD